MGWRLKKMWHSSSLTLYGKAPQSGVIGIGAACLPACCHVPACLLACLLACLPACLPACLSACLFFFSAWSTACTGAAAVFCGYKPLYTMHAYSQDMPSTKNRLPAHKRNQSMPSTQYNHGMCACMYNRHHIGFGPSIVSTLHSFNVCLT